MKILKSLLQTRLSYWLLWALTHPMKGYFFVVPWILSDCKKVWGAKKPRQNVKSSPHISFRNSVIVSGWLTLSKKYHNEEKRSRNTTRFSKNCYISLLEHLKFSSHMCGCNCTSLTVIPSTFGKGVFHIWFCGVHVAEAQGRWCQKRKKAALEVEFVIIPIL